MCKGSSALPISRGSAGPKSRHNLTETTGNWLIFQCHHATKVDAVWTAEPGLRPVELRNLVEAVMAGSERSSRERKSAVHRAREKTSMMSVPRSDTGALPEQGKACRENRR